MKRIYILLIGFTLCVGQSYTITIFGMAAANVEQNINTTGSIEFTTQNRGFFDLIWPTRNVYTTQYDPETFGITSWSKKIRQGEFQSNISAELDSSGSLVYNDKTKINIQSEAQTIFTLLAMVQLRDMETLDTKWFNYEHEGLLGKARFIWADSTNIWSGKDSTLCDHYRLDININEELGKFMTNTDYFMEKILADGVVRELWVSRKKPKRIMNATLKTKWFPLSATINE
jgi:hypothetical protein